MRSGQDRVFAQPGLYLGLMFLVISAQLFWWLLFFTEIRYALVHVEDERDTVLLMLLNGEADQIKAPGYFIKENSRYAVDPAVLEERRRERDRHIVMLVSEASFFLAVFGVGSIILVRLYRRERQLAKEQELFLNSFTHELKTPLAAIKLNLQTLKRKPERSDGPDLIEGSLGQVDILNRRISEILLGGEIVSDSSDRSGYEGTNSTDTSGIQHAKERSGAKAVAVLETVLGELQSPIRERRARITVGWLTPLKGKLKSLLPEKSSVPGAFIELPVVDERGHLLSTNLQSLRSLDEYRLRMDAREFALVCSEMITNALIHSESPVVLRILLREKGRRMQIYFIDHGPGIPWNERKNIFRPMIRLEQKEGFIPGTGMGLSNVRSLIARSKGRINVRPSPAGARFLIELPYGSDR